MLKHLQDFALGLKSLRQSKEISEENIRLKEEELDNLMGRFKESQAFEKEKWPTEKAAKEAQAEMWGRMPAPGGYSTAGMKAAERNRQEFQYKMGIGPSQLASAIQSGDWERYLEARTRYVPGALIPEMNEEYFKWLSEADIDAGELRKMLTYNLATQLIDVLQLDRKSVSDAYFPEYNHDLFTMPSLETVVKHRPLQEGPLAILPKGQPTENLETAFRGQFNIPQQGVAEQAMEKIGQVLPKGGQPTGALDVLKTGQGAGQAPPGELVEVNGSVYTVTKDNKVYLNDGTLVERRELVDMVLKKYMAEQKKKLEQPKPQVLSGGRGQLQGQYMSK
jgi:hypothetical protein